MLEFAGLDYEAYVPMAVKVMRSIGERIVKERGVSKIFMAHRVGRLQVKEPAVVIAVSAPHRAEAIGASRLAIDELKLHSQWCQRPGFLPQPQNFFC